MTAILIREANAEDAATLAVLHGASFQPAWDEASMAGLLGKNATAALATQDGKAVGFALSRIAVDEAELISIAVSPMARNQGLGRALLSALCAHLKECGVHTLFLEVASDNAAAVHLYESFGFSRLGLRKKYYANGADALTYSLTLG
ncbi:MAG: ribosomal protein S18-alanine N-acetyltransferase [Robiginitomaculum sp.]|nr:ribosomal protein S18-alanine N-acetyltransferase [Robiginitomaculum sp.]MDQ7078727.1 ribosomal protein S18-alanine N-acetyltransferase [Robiginitomaculum sp.]